MMMMHHEIDETLSTIAAMRQQEERTYKLTQQMQGETDDKSRKCMVSWMFQIVDYFKFQRDTVSIAVSYLDRFLACCSTTSRQAKSNDNDKLYQLVAMTCLYTAIKIHEPLAMDVKTLVHLARNTYTANEIESMERILLNDLRWKMNPPTAQAFLREYLELIPASVLCSKERKAVFELAKYQAELAVKKSDFRSLNASTVALCALMNALESIVTLDQFLLRQIVNALSQSIGMDLLTTHNQDETILLEVRNALYHAVQEQQHATTLSSSPVVVKIGRGDGLTMTQPTTHMMAQTHVESLPDHHHHQFVNDDDATTPPSFKQQQQPARRRRRSSSPRSTMQLFGLL